MQLLEVQKIETIDGRKLTFTGDVYLQGFVNYGMAEPNYVTQRGYVQSGETVRSFTLNPRTISINIFTKARQGATRTDYWDDRARILDIFRPNRGANRLNQLSLTIRREDGSRRKIACFYESGLEFEDVNKDANAFRVLATVTLFCPTPIWYDADIITLDVESAQATQLVFPISFPITFGVSGTQFKTGNLNYQGTWRSYPTITISGPYQSATLILNNASIRLFNPITKGEQRIIALSESGFSITDADGNDAFNDVQRGDIVNFFIRPSDQLADGVTQEISVTLVGGVDSTSSVTITYSTAYIGL